LFLNEHLKVPEFKYFLSIFNQTNPPLMKILKDKKSNFMSKI